MGDEPAIRVVSKRVATANPIRIVPTTIKDANRIVARWHRHNKPVQGALYAVAAESCGEICGVAIVGRPIGKLSQDGVTCEIVRVATNGEYNACSILYGACCRAAKALGYQKVLTKTLVEEPGASLRAAGFKDVGVAKEQTWDRPARRRIEVDLFGNKTTPSGPKRKWERIL